MPESILRLNDVKKVFAPDAAATVSALNGVSFEVFRGEFVAITGASGSGKSTLLNLIGLLDTPTGGEILFQGISLAGMNERERNRFRLQAISFVFQFFNLIDNYTALENIAFQLELQGKSREEARKTGREILGFLHLGHKADHYPKDLSGGEQQRVAIGRGLSKDSIILLADEPTAHLDSKNADEIMSLLRHINTAFGRTIILVTHEPSQAKQASRRIIMKDGLVEREEAGDDPVRLIVKNAP